MKSYKFGNLFRHLIHAIDHQVLANTNNEKLHEAGTPVLASTNLDKEGYYCYIIGIALGVEETDLDCQDIWKGWTYKEDRKDGKSGLVSSETIQKCKMEEQIFTIHKSEIPPQFNYKSMTFSKDLALWLWQRGMLQLRSK